MSIPFEQWENSSAGLDHTHFPNVSTLTLYLQNHNNTFFFSFELYSCWLLSLWSYSRDDLLICLNLLPSTMGLSTWQKPLGISMLWITTGTTMHCCLSSQMSFSLLQELEPHNNYASSVDQKVAPNKRLLMTGEAARIRNVDPVKTWAFRTKYSLHPNGQSWKSKWCR